LPVEVDATTIATEKQFRVTRLGLRDPAFGPSDLPFNRGCSTSDFFIRALKQLRERQLDMRRHTIDLREPIAARFFQERCERVLVKPSRGLGQHRGTRQFGRCIRRGEVANQRGLAQFRLAIRSAFHCEEPLVNHLAEAVHHARPVEIDAGRSFVLERMEGRAFPQNVQSLRVRVSPDRLE
jgi:hypothetical protein